MDAADRALLEETVREAVTEAAIEAGPTDKVLMELGWLEMLDAEPRDAIDIVFTALGEAGATASVLDDVVAAALGVEPRPDVAVLLPRFAAWAVPGAVDGSRLCAEGLATARVADATGLLVVAADAGGARIATVPVSAAEIAVVTGIDPDGRFHRVRVEHDAATVTPLDPDAWQTAIAAARRAVAHQVLGASRTMLDLARTHALDRTQFGRPIAAFQAVRHKLAEALVALEALVATLGAAWDDGGPITAALAKAVSGRTARTVGGHAQQVLAGIGFTTDHPFHRFLKRTIVLDGLFGSTDEIAVALGRQVLATRTVPTLIEL